MKTGIAGLLIVVTSSLLSGCGGSDTSDGAVAYIDEFSGQSQRKSSAALTDDSASKILSLHLDSAFKQFAQLALRIENISFDSFEVSTERNNTFTTPLSTQLFLAQLAMGARGTTSDAFAEASNFNDINGINYADFSLWEQQIDKLESLDTQNVLWGQTGYRFSRNFLSAQVNYWGPEMIGLDFLQDPYQAGVIVGDRLVEEQVSQDMDSRTRLVTLKASQLSSGWSSDVDITSVTGRFGEQARMRVVNMLRFEGELNAVDAVDYSAIELPLADKGLSMLVITPAEGQFENIRTGLDGDFWNNLLATLSPVNTSIYLPEFKLQRELLSESILGLGVAFMRSMDLIDAVGSVDELVSNISDTSSVVPKTSDLQANFSAVNNEGFLYLEYPAQHMTLQLDSAGLNARTALAAVHSATLDEPVTLFDDFSAFNANFDMISIGWPSFQTSSCLLPSNQLPFIFVIYAKDTGALLYLGQVKVLDVDAVEVGCGGNE